MLDESNGNRIQRTGSNRSKRDKAASGADGAPDSSAASSVERTTFKPRKVYVSNIPYKCRQQDLKDLFSEVGEVVSVELFIDEEIKPRGCGLVEYVDEASVPLAVKKFNRHDIDGRKILVREDGGEERDKFGRTKNQGKKAHSQHDQAAIYNTYGLNSAFLDKLGIEGPLLNRIFVSNLDFKVDAKKLTQIFKMAGKILDVEMGVDNDGNSRGFAIIEYEHPVEAVQAISMFDRQLLYERRMFVRLDKKADRNENLKFLDGLGGIGRGLGPNGKPLKNIAASLQHTNVHLRHPLDIDGNAASTAAGLLGPVPGHIDGASGGGGGGGVGGSGIGNQVPNLGNIEALSNLLSVAASLNNLGLAPGGANLDMANVATLKSLAQQKQMHNLGQPNDMAGMGGHKKSETIVIKNLPLNYSWKILRDKCSLIGDVKHTKITNPDYGLVRFNTIQEAEKAVMILDGARFDGRTVSVTFL